MFDLAVIRAATSAIGRSKVRTNNGDKMGSYSAEDHKKFVHASGARDVRRLTAVIQRLALDPVTYNEIACHLEQLECRLLSLAFVRCHLQDGEEEVSVVNRQGFYGDGRPVTTTIRSDDGFVTIVHDPDPDHAESTLGPEQLAAECWPEGIREGDTHHFDSDREPWNDENGSEDDF
jgi:hypothetical protein